MEILNHRQIERKITRLAYEILENSFHEDGLIIAGLNQNGMAFASLLLDRLESITEVDVQLTQITLNPADPLSETVEIDLDNDELAQQHIIIVDDVANTGRTIFYAFKSLLDALPAKVEVAVLVDRKHKSFPIMVDYVGLSLATTLKENIDVRLDSEEGFAAYLN